MASSYRALGRTEEALVGYRRLLEIAGADTGASIAIADIEFDRGNLDAAAETLHQAVATTEAPGLISNKLAEALARRGIELDPQGESGPLGYYVFADILNRTGRSAEAKQAVEAGQRIQQQIN